VGRKRRGRRTGKTGGGKTSGGALTSLRGGFRSVARGVTGSGAARPTSRAGRLTSNLVTILLLLVVVAVVLRRFGLHHR
jgi:hypothetical protein